MKKHKKLVMLGVAALLLAATTITASAATYWTNYLPSWAGPIDLAYSEKNSPYAPYAIAHVDEVSNNYSSVYLWVDYAVSKAEATTGHNRCYLGTDKYMDYAANGWTGAVYLRGDSGNHFEPQQLKVSGRFWADGK